MSEKHTQNSDNNVVFDDTMLPVSRITAQRAIEIEKMILPSIEEELGLFIKNNPELFPVSTK